MRERYLRWSTAHSLNQALNNPDHKGDPYPKEFPSCVIEVMGDGNFTVREDTPEDIERRRRMLEEAKTLHGEVAARELQSLVATLQSVEYIGEDTVQVRGRRGPIAGD